MSKEGAQAQQTVPEGTPARHHLRVPLEVAVNLESDHNFYAGITDNISEGGIFVAMDHCPAKGTVVEMSLSLPDVAQPFLIKGTVCWIRDRFEARDGSPAGCGLSFLELSPDALKAIHTFVQLRETILFDTD